MLLAYNVESNSTKLEINFTAKSIQVNNQLKSNLSVPPSSFPAFPTASPPRCLYIQVILSSIACFLPCPLLLLPSIGLSILFLTVFLFYSSFNSFSSFPLTILFHLLYGLCPLPSTLPPSTHLPSNPPTLLPLPSLPPFPPHTLLLLLLFFLLVTYLLKDLWIN